MEGMLLNLIVDERSVKEEERHTEGPGLNLIPFDHRAADIVSAYQKVRFGKAAERAFAREIGSDIREGV